jgi:hypothetical protein
MPLRLNVLASNAVLDSGLNALNGATIKLYDGTQPGTGGATITTETELASGTLPSPAFAPASSRGRGPADSWELTGGALATGQTATWARISTSGGAIVDLDVGDTNESLVLTTTEISEFDIVRVTGGAIFLPGNDES